MARTKKPVFIQLLNAGEFPVDVPEVLPANGAGLPEPMRKVFGGDICALASPFLGCGGILGTVRAVGDGPFEMTISKAYRDRWNRRLHSLRRFVDAWMNHGIGTKAHRAVVDEGVDLGQKVYVTFTPDIPKGSHGERPADLRLKPVLTCAIPFGGEDGNNPDAFFCYAWYEVLASIEVAQAREAEGRGSRHKWAPRRCKSCGDFYAVDFWLEKKRLEGPTPSQFCSLKCKKRGIASGSR